VNDGVRPATDAVSEGPTIAAKLIDGPLEGRQVDAAVTQGRPPSVVEAVGDDGLTYRYCLAEWDQHGPSAEYTFLYRV
jgi:hypothetical protein